MIAQVTLIFLMQRRAKELSCPSHAGSEHAVSALVKLFQAPSITLSRIIWIKIELTMGIFLLVLLILLLIVSLRLIFIWGATYDGN